MKPLYPISEKNTDRPGDEPINAHVFHNKNDAPCIVKLWIYKQTSYALKLTESQVGVIFDNNMCVCLYLVLLTVVMVCFCTRRDVYFSLLANK